MQAIFANATAASADDDGLKAAKRREVEQRIAMRDHRLIDIEESDAVMDEVFGMLKSELLGIPARVSRELDLRQKVEREIDDALNRAADRLAKRAAELRTTGKMGT
ncbi:MAG: hypothetical protein E5Y79_16095 [Mesorhizobium sp.]|uniref:hypothetical protein n=1 Tax=Mesorhizobium sp. TaxID=1871066 RepID=UPI0012070594|nr:hypothetical protein [Mesorhizobium sp.]TIL59256.1 MAG: hypothetical protein E5Y79_16095 [Mesorhizobium sp.]TIL95202.1 MAG: hypothetical protein E5Y73_07535 [Mesorhizobium sp.]